MGKMALKGKGKHWSLVSSCLGYRTSCVQVWHPSLRDVLPVRHKKDLKNCRMEVKAEQTYSFFFFFGLTWEQRYRLAMKFSLPPPSLFLQWSSQEPAEESEGTGGIFFVPSLQKQRNVTGMEVNGRQSLAALVVPAGAIWLLGPWPRFSGRWPTRMR